MGDKETLVYQANTGPDTEPRAEIFWRGCTWDLWYITTSDWRVIIQLPLIDLWKFGKLGQIIFQSSYVCFFASSSNRYDFIFWWSSNFGIVGGPPRAKIEPSKVTWAVRPFSISFQANRGSNEVIRRLSINRAEKQLKLIKLAEICAAPCMCVLPARAVKDLFWLVFMASVETLGLSRHPARPPLFQMLPWWNLWVLSRQPDSGLRAGDDCCVRVIDTLLERERRREGGLNSLCSSWVVLQRSGVDLSRVLMWLSPQH